MENGKTFKTKDGICHLLQDKIVLTSNEKSVAETILSTKNRMPIILVVFSIIAVILFCFSVNEYRNNRLIESVIFGLAGIYAVYANLINIHASTIPVIDRKSIKEVKLKKGIVGLTRSRFEVFFVDEKGKTKKRFVMLPGSLEDGKNETANAIQLMRTEGLMGFDV